jgi:hypothetical protein
MSRIINIVDRFTLKRANSEERKVVFRRQPRQQILAWGRARFRACGTTADRDVEFWVPVVSRAVGTSQ